MSSLLENQFRRRRQIITKEDADNEKMKVISQVLKYGKVNRNNIAYDSPVPGMINEYFPNELPGPLFMDYACRIKSHDEMKLELDKIVEHFKELSKNKKVPVIIIDSMANLYSGRSRK